jgi:NSS family neurotransmitter:Na+ symporter
MVQYGIDRFKITRKKASVIMGGFFYIVGILVILSGFDGTKEALTWGGKNLFDWIDFITAAIMLPMGGLLMSIFVGYVLPKSEVEATLKPYLKGYFEIWYFSLRYIAPISLFIVVLNLIGVI